MAKVSLKAARVNAKLNQKDAAKKLNVSNSTLCNWEKGISFPDAKQIQNICALYGVSYDDIIFLPDNPIKPD